MSTTDNFFDSQSEKSKVKTMIVTEFLKAYFPIILNSIGKESPEIIYIDLFCGPGKFDDEQLSTPIALLDLISSSNNDTLYNKLRIIFNDEKKEYTDKLRAHVNTHDVLPKLKIKPEISNKTASDIDISVLTARKCPIFSFIDPWGYTDVTAEQTWTLVKNLGSDCVLFFNSNRFLMDIPKTSQTNHFKQIFGDQLPLVERVVNDRAMTQKQKTQKIVELFSKNLCTVMGKACYLGYKLFVLPFGFEADDREKISHHILFITKNHKAIKEMKKVMLKHNNNIGDQLLFDSKDQLQFTLFNRTEFIVDGIIELLKHCFRSNIFFFDETWTIGTIMEALDTFSMKDMHQVSPYSLDEIKSAIKVLDSKGLIELKLAPNQKIREKITDLREFKIRKELLV